MKDSKHPQGLSTTHSSKEPSKSPAATNPKPPSEPGPTTESEKRSSGLSPEDRASALDNLVNFLRDGHLQNREHPDMMQFELKDPPPLTNKIQ